MKKKDIIAGIVVLLSISVLSGFLLAQAYRLTKPKIEEQKKIEEERLNREIFNEGIKFSQDKVKERPCTAVYKENGELAGWIFDLKTTGYGGNILIKAGFDSDMKIRGIRILEHTETPGLGSKITDTKFLAQFKGMEPSVLYLKKDKSEGLIDGITGATISSRAVTESVRKLQEELE